MAEMIDLTEVQAAVDAMKERSKPLLKGSGIDNVIARLQTDVAGAAVIWRAKESNLGTDPNLIGEALCTGFVADMMGEIKQHLANAPFEVQAMAVNAVMAMLADKFAGLLSMSDETWNSLSNRIDVIEAGTS